MAKKILIEGEDYYIEGGKWVFTEKYHLNRGFCCNKGCRHCAYKSVKNNSESSNGESQKAE